MRVSPARMCGRSAPTPCAFCSARHDESQGASWPQLNGGPATSSPSASRPPTTSSTACRPTSASPTSTRCSPSCPSTRTGASTTASTGSSRSTSAGPPGCCTRHSYADGTWDTIYGYQRRWVAGAAGRTDELVRPPLAHRQTSPTWSGTSGRVRTGSTTPASPRSAGGRERAILFNLRRARARGQPNRVRADAHRHAARPAAGRGVLSSGSPASTPSSDRVLRAAGGLIDAVCVQDDFGTQQGPAAGPRRVPPVLQAVPPGGSSRRRV